MRSPASISLYPAKGRITLYLVALLGIFLCGGSPIYAQQTEIDSLLRELRGNLHDTTRSLVLSEISSWLLDTDPDGAMIRAKEAQSVARRAGFKRGEARALLMMGTASELQGNHESALDYYRKNLKIVTGLGDHDGMATVLNSLGTLHHDQGKYTQALDYYRQSLEIDKQLGDKQGMGVSLNNIGAVHHDQGQYEEALEYYEQSLKMRKQAGAQEDVSISLSLIGSIYHDRGQYEKALEYYRRSLDIDKELGDRQGVSGLLNMMATIYHDQGQYESALETYLESLEIVEQIGDKMGIASALNNIGEIHLAQGRYAKAKEYYEKSLQLFEEDEDYQGVATALLNIGNIHMEQGELDQALECYQRCMKLSEQLGDKDGIAWTLNSIGVIYLRQARTEEALAYQQRSLKLFQEFGRQREISMVLNTMGEIYATQDKLDSAITTYKNAYSIAKRIGAVQEVIDAATGLSRTYAKQNRFEDALKYQREYSSFKDSLMNETNLKSINEMSERYEAEKREQQIALLEKDKSLQALELNRQQLEAARQRQQLTLLGKERALDSLSLRNTNAELARQRTETEKKQLEVSSLQKDKKLQAAQLERERMMMNIYIAGLVLSVLLAVALYNRYRYKKRTSEQLQVSYDHLQRTQKQLIHAEKMATLGEFTAGVAHEIKNPLNFVNNFSVMNKRIVGELEEFGEDPEERAELLAMLKENSDLIFHHGSRADKIVNSMLEHSRETGGARVPTEINELVKDAAELAQQGGPHEQIGLHFELAEDIGQVEVLPAEISRVVLSLVDNAIYSVEKRSSSEGDYDPSVTISTTRTADNIHIIVVDNGIGMSDEVKEKLFQPFFTTKPTGEGTGLGLSLCWDIVSSGHNGTIEVESEEGNGSTIRVCLPLSH